ncbi:MAG: hypothetical protein RLZ98_969 [Pseudomonadota bacterium]|jgi:hypothetical protein
MENLQTTFVIATIFLITTGFFNKAYRIRLYAAAVVLLLLSYGIHYHRLAHEPGYAEKLSQPKGTGKQ